MASRRWRRKVRCILKHGPRGCPHIERHTRRSKRARPDPPVAAPMRPTTLPAALTEQAPGGRHALP